MFILKNGFDLRGKHYKQMLIKSIPDKLNFIFDDTILSVEKDLLLEVESNEMKFNEANEVYVSIEWDNLDINENGLSYENECLIDSLSEYEFEIKFAKDKLKSLIEMKIINLYKTYEILQKELIALAFPKQEEKNFYQWQNVRNLMDEHNIMFVQISEYPFINQLRMVNNNIKHSSIIDSNIKKSICEFKEQNEFTYESLDAFYKRVSCKVKLFLKSFSIELLNYLYFFPDDRIESIADIYSDRMDTSEIRKLID
ncbi:hypothetical protein, partial [Photobacterium kishitanii]